MAGTLYICPTPIGNMDDITLRTIKTLRSVDLIAAEDTRHTQKLLNHLDIKVRVTSYYEHNKVGAGNKLIEALRGGMNIALVSDAGTPAISDPGEDLVRLCVAEDIAVVPLPGATALITALIASGLSTGRFAFEGFLSVRKQNRKKHLDGLINEKRTMIFYEAPHKLQRTLSDMLAVFGNRRICIARELTKIYEEVMRVTLAEAVDIYSERPAKGEFVLIVEGTKEEPVYSDAEILTEIERMIESGMSGRDAVTAVAEKLSIPKKRAYALMLTQI